MNKLRFLNSTPGNFFSHSSIFNKLISDRWRSLLMLLIKIHLPLLVFGTLAVVGLENKGGFPWDEPILLAVHKTAQVQLDILAATLTKFGEFWRIFPVATLTSVIFLGQSEVAIASVFNHNSARKQFH